jgi:hypothetical protein
LVNLLCSSSNFYLIFYLFILVLILASAAFRSGGGGGGRATNGTSTGHRDDELFMNQLDQAHLATRQVISEGEALLYEIGGRVSDGDAFMHQETGHLKRKGDDDLDDLDSL